MIKIVRWFGIVFLLHLAVVSQLLGKPHPLIGRKAPELTVKKWFFLEKGQAIPALKNYTGKVVYIYCYQSWCPGCHKFGFPALKRMTREFSDEKDIVFLAVQTVFEGFGSNTEQKIEKTRKKYDLNIPFGHDDGQGNGSRLMKDYYSGGTPWHIIIDKQGNIIYCGFHVDVDKTINVLHTLIAKE